MMLPQFTNLTTWANSLIIDFPKDNIPFLDKEENWHQWGNNLIQCNSFIKNNAPSTNTYEDWKPWAQRVFFCMTNSS